MFFSTCFPSNPSQRKISCPHGQAMARGGWCRISAVRLSWVSTAPSTPTPAGPTQLRTHPLPWDGGCGFGPGPLATSLSVPSERQPGVSCDFDASSAPPAPAPLSK